MGWQRATAKLSGNNDNHCGWGRKRRAMTVSLEAFVSLISQDVIRADYATPDFPAESSIQQFCFR